MPTGVWKRKKNPHITLHWSQPGYHSEWVAWKRKTDPFYTQKYEMKRKYGITYEDFLEMRDKQGGVCAICGGDNGDKHLAIDHCHTTGKIRGLLCNNCNTAIGMLQDDPTLLNKAVEYLT